MFKYLLFVNNLTKRIKNIKMKNKTKGENMIKVSIYFHTTSSEGITLPLKTAFKAGMVVMPVNHKHGIKSGIREPFSNHQQSLIEAIKGCLKKSEVKLVDVSKEKEYKNLLKMQNTENFFDEEMKL